MASTLPTSGLQPLVSFQSKRRPVMYREGEEYGKHAWIPSNIRVHCMPAFLVGIFNEPIFFSVIIATPCEDGENSLNYLLNSSGVIVQCNEDTESGRHTCAV